VSSEKPGPLWNLAPIEFPKRKACAQCGKDVAGEMGEHRHGEFICAQCKADPGRIVQHLLELSDRGDESLQAIRGYRILKELGRGGMGAVYLAVNARNGEQVALKVMLPQTAADENAKQLFLREVENTKALKNTKIAFEFEETRRLRRGIGRERPALA
jgi:serine/threonine protein kinase